MIRSGGLHCQAFIHIHKIFYLVYKSRYTICMTEVLHANIFFIIASIGVIVFTTLVAIAIYQIVRILKSVRNIVERVEEGSETIAEDVSQLRSYVIGGSFLSQIISVFMGTKSRRSRKRTTDNE